MGLMVLPDLQVWLKSPDLTAIAVTIAASRSSSNSRDAGIEFENPDSHALRKLVARAHAEGVDRLELRLSPEDPARLRAGLDAGFAIEGMRRDVPRDSVVLARLAADPAEPVSRVLPDLPGGRLTDGVVTVRPIRPSDVDDYLTLEAIPDVAHAYLGPPITRESATTRLNTAEYRWLAGETAQCVITDAESGAFSGTIQLLNRQPTGIFMLGYALDPRWRGKGFATRAVELMTAWAFSLGVVRVIAGTFPDNLGSQAVLQRAGFTLEAVYKSALCRRDGTRIDNVQFVRFPPRNEP